MYRVGPSFSLESISKNIPFPILCRRISKKKKIKEFTVIKEQFPILDGKIIKNVLILDLELLIGIRILLEIQIPLCYKPMFDLDIEGRKFTKMALPEEDDHAKIMRLHKK
jgi:hypothetical protein